MPDNLLKSGSNWQEDNQKQEKKTKLFIFLRSISDITVIY